MWIVFALFAALSAAIVTVLSKAGLKNIDSSLAFAVESVLIICISWAVVAAQGNLGEIANIDRRTWIYLIIAGIFTSLSSLFTFRALKLGDASKVNPLERLSLVFVVIFAAFFLKERITWQVIMGVLLMIGGAVLIALANKQ